MNEGCMFCGYDIEYYEFQHFDVNRAKLGFYYDICLKCFENKGGNELWKTDWQLHWCPCKVCGEDMENDFNYFTFKHFSENRNNRVDIGLIHINCMKEAFGLTTVGLTTFGLEV
jgi:hypothetical protein